MKILTDKDGKPILVDGKVICVDDVVYFKEVSSDSFFINNNILNLYSAENRNIDQRITRRPIVPTNLDYAVKQALCDGKGADWTTEEQLAARQRLGLGDWEFLNYYTVETDTTKLNFSADDKGNPYNLRKVLMYVLCPSAHNGYIYVNADTNVMTRVPIKNSNQPYCLYEAEANGVFAIQLGAYGLYNNNLASVLKTIPFSKKTYIQELDFSVYNNDPIMAGTKITIYGIRA